MTDLSVYIIGGGPAGCATALSLKRQATKLGNDVNIVLCDAPHGASPAVGETVPPVLIQYLRELGIQSLLEDGDHILCPGSISVWQDEQPGYNDFFLTPVGNGYHLNRKQFNQQLLDACHQHQIPLLTHTKLTQIEESSDGFILTLRHERTDNPTTESQHKCAFVVDASGLQRTVTNKLGVAQNTFDQVISLCAFYPLDGEQKKAFSTLVSSAREGWWYGTQIPGDKALISFCTDSPTIKKLHLSNPKNWQQQLMECSWFMNQCQQQFNRTLGIPEKIHMRPSPSSILSNVTGKNWLSVGDAASCYDSISSAGITKSIYQGIKAGQAIAHSLIDNTSSALISYQDKVFSDFNQYLGLHQMHYHSGGHRFQHQGFWGRRLLAS